MSCFGTRNLTGTAHIQGNHLQIPHYICLRSSQENLHMCLEEQGKMNLLRISKEEGNLLNHIFLRNGPVEIGLLLEPYPTEGKRY